MPRSDQAVRWSAARALPATTRDPEVRRAAAAVLVLEDPRDPRRHLAYWEGSEHGHATPLARTDRAVAIVEALAGETVTAAEPARTASDVASRAGDEEG